jgi:glyoxylase-like metal-dependent hydrolase (beta-lactamase superfamily II)
VSQKETRDPRVICLTNGMFEENCYILADPVDRQAVLIDPGEQADLFLRRLETEGLTLTAVWLTHAHIDHIAGVETVVERTSVPIYLHSADRALYGHVSDQAKWLGVREVTPPEPDRELAAGDTLDVGELRFDVRHVPGHSPGGVAFVGHGVAFVGDALFAGSIGRTDLPGGNTQQLLDAIRNQLFTLPEETVVYPGHGPETTIGQEKRSNPFLTGEIRLT